MAVFNSGLLRHDLSPTARQALAALEGAEGPLSPTAISERLLVTTASITSLLDTLERRGLVQRQPDPDDRRRQWVSLTSAGQAIVDEFLPEIVALQAAIMADVSEADRQQLMGALATVRTTIAELDVDAIVAAAPARRKPGRHHR